MSVGSKLSWASIYQCSTSLTICEVVGIEKKIVLNTGKLYGTPPKLISADLLRAMGWFPRIGLREDLSSTNEWFQANEV